MNEPKHLLRNILAEVLEISDARQRAAFLDRECGADGNLRRKVEELIRAEADAGYFLPGKPATTGSGAALREFVSALGQNDSLPNAPLTTKPGDHIGRYRLLEKIGEGGCGVVYAAEQGEPVRRRVALKVIKLGMDTKSVVARFDAERQTLALMDHPNIAKVFDAGATDTGRPFFVMELVHGTRITDYCDQHQLSTRERLELFIQVCRAVQHAHQKGIIHRDIKPSNILVTVSDGIAVPKVIDFGIAKATQGKLTDQTLFTAFEQFLGTPAYMSPEQAAMTSLDIDTRSDIYSLGVLLYELLTGRTPFDTKELLALGVDELRRTIREKEPKRPSTRLAQDLAAANRGVTRPTAVSAIRNSQSAIDSDLDWIVMRCLEKDRARRYETANGLAADLRRYLNNEPVVARPPSRLYEFQKAVRRHKVGFTATAAVIGTLVAGVFASSWQAIRVTRAEREQTLLRQKAEAEAYTSHMNLALKAWEEGNLKRAQALLRRNIPSPGETDLRGFEWRYLWKLCQDESLYTVKLEEDDSVLRLATSPAHSVVAAACDKTIRLLEPSTGRELVRFFYPNPEATNGWPAMALAAGMTNLLAAHRAEGVVGLWDVASRKLLMTFKPFTNNIGSMALSPDGKLLAAADRGQQSSYGTAMTVWDISSRPQPPHLVWSNSIKEVIAALVFSPDGQFLVVSRSSQGAYLDTLDVATGSVINCISNASAGQINAMAFSPDGALLASSGVEGRINIWDFTNQTLKFYFDGNAGSVASLGFSADGGRLISAGYDGAIRRWDIASRKDAGLWRAPQGGDLKAVLAPDGKSIVSGARNEVRIWNPEPREEATLIKVQEGWSWPIVSPDSKSLIVSGWIDSTGSQGAAVWDIASGQHKFDLACKAIGAESLAFSPEGRFFALGGVEKEGVVGLWDTSTWEKGALRVEPFAYLTNGFEAGSICFSPDGKILAVAGRSFPPDYPKEPSGATNRLAFWEVGSWKKLDLVPQAGAGATEWAAAATVALSNDGRLLAVGSRDGWVRLWDFNHGRLLKEIKELEDGSWGVTVTFSSDNRWVASFTMGGPSIVLLDLADPEHPLPVPLSREEQGGVHWALFAPDKKSLITANNDGLIKFWNLQTRSVVLTLRHGHGPGGFLALAPDGNFLASKDAHGTVKIWPVASLAEIPKFKPAENDGGSE